MNADVIFWGPMGTLHKGVWKSQWVDLKTSELQDAIDWVILEQMRAFKDDDGQIRNFEHMVPQVFLYDGTLNTDSGFTVKVGKLRGGHATRCYYLIVSDEKIETADQALELVREALEGGDTDGT